MRFLVFLAVINTVLFTAAKLADISTVWVVGVEVCCYVLWIAWKAWWHPAQQLTNQAVHMHWTAAGMVRDEKGFRDTLLQKDGIVVRISYQRRDVEIIEPFPAGPFKDFVEIDRFLQSHQRLFGLTDS